VAQGGGGANLSLFAGNKCPASGPFRAPACDNIRYGLLDMTQKRDAAMLEVRPNNALSSLTTAA
jgi:hypothetical protein